MSLIECKDLGIYFDSENWIFRHLNFKVESGESICFLGPSGSGKSVLFKIIAGLISPSEGAVQLGSDNLGMLFQKNALFDSLTVEENLLFPLKERMGLEGAEAQQKVAKYLSGVQLSGSERLYPAELSGGMQKRLGIARALVVEPEVILYDEPTAGLDPITSRSITQMILDLQREAGSTVLCISNDVHRAYQMSDKIFLLAQGQLSEGLTPDQARKTENLAMKQFLLGLREGPLTSELER